METDQRGVDNVVDVLGTGLAVPGVLRLQDAPELLQLWGKPLALVMAYFSAPSGAYF